MLNYQRVFPTKSCFLGGGQYQGLRIELLQLSPDICRQLGFVAMWIMLAKVGVRIVGMLINPFYRDWMGLTNGTIGFWMGFTDIQWDLLIFKDESDHDLTSWLPWNEGSFYISSSPNGRMITAIFRLVNYYKSLNYSGNNYYYNYSIVIVW
jgi:hypothetical protein